MQIVYQVSVHYYAEQVRPFFNSPNRTQLGLKCDALICWTYLSQACYDKYNNFLLVVRMSQAQIYSKIREYFGHNSADYHFQRQNSQQQSLTRLIDSLPHLTPQQVRNVCKAQEQNIIQKVLPLRPIDLYKQITEVCPDEKDLQHISTEQVSSRLNLYNSKLILTERPTFESQSESEQSWGTSKSQVFFGEVNFNICLMEEEQPQEAIESQTMRNIFEECDNQNCWNTNQYFGLS